MAIQPNVFFPQTIPVPASLLDANFTYLTGKCVSALYYGAVGDGVTDDAAALQLGIDTLSGGGGGTLYLPGPKTYLVSTGIQYKDNVNIVGDGRGVTVIKLKTGSNVTGSRAIVEQAFNVALPARGYNSKNNTLAHFSIDGNVAGNAGKVYEGISGYQVKDLFVYDVEAYNCGECGLQGQVTNKNTDQKSLVVFMGCISHNNVSDGIQVGGADVISCWSFSNGASGISSAGNYVSGNVDDIETHIIGCRAEYNTSAGIIAAIQLGPNIRTLISNCTAVHNGSYGVALNMNGTKVVNCTAEFNTLSGYFIDHDYCSIVGGSANSNTQNGVVVPGGVNYCKVHALLATLNGAYGIAFTSGLGTGSHNTVSGCTLSGNTTAAIQNGAAAGPDWRVTDCEGYNPVGPFGGASTPTNPSVPASTVTKTNTYGYSCRVYIAGGTVTVISIAGTATGQTSGSFVVGPGETIAITYTVAPTWAWFGL